MKRVSCGRKSIERDTKKTKGGGVRKKGDVFLEEYYTYANGGTINDVLNEYRGRKQRRAKYKKMATGGRLEDGLHEKKKVGVIFKSDENIDSFNTDTYEDINTRHFAKDLLYILDFYMFDKNNNEVYLEIAPKETIVVDRDDIRVEGYDVDFSEDVDAYDYLLLSQNDKEVIQALTRISIDTATIDQIEYLATFQGDNIANKLTTEFIKDIYGYLFKYKSASFEINTIGIWNNGVGNILSLAPKFANCYVRNKEHKKDNEVSYQVIENMINDIQNKDKHLQRWDYYNNEDFISMSIVTDAFICVHPQTNPEGSVMDSLLIQQGGEQAQQIGISVAEFSDISLMERFKKNQGESFLTNDENTLTFQRINRGLTENGKVTLISIFKNGF